MKITAILLVALGLVSSAFCETLPPDAEALKAKRDAKIAEINQLYAEALGKLQKKALAEGNLDAANLIEKEIATATPDPFINPVKTLIGKWKRTGAGALDGHLFHFTNEKSGLFNGQTPFSVKYAEPTGVITIPPFTDIIKFTDDADVLEGVTDRGVAYNLVRVQ